MTKKTKEQLQAEYLYIQTDFTAGQISEFLSIDRKTLYRWMKDGQWKRAKYIGKHAPPILCEQYLETLGQLNASISARADRPFPTMEEADIMRKVALTYKTIKGRQKIISDTIEVFCDFMSHRWMHDKKMAEQIIPQLDEYVQSLINDGQGLDSVFSEWVMEKAADREYERSVAEHRTPPAHPTSFTDFCDRGGDPLTDPSDYDTPHTDMPHTPGPEAQDGAINGAMPSAPTPSDTATGNHINENDNTDLSTKNNNGACPTPGPDEGHDRHATARFYASLPPAQRPSPFRDGDILWVNNIDDTDERLNNQGHPWGERKIGDRVRRYSDIDRYDDTLPYRKSA